MNTFKFDQMLQKDGWKENICITVDEYGKITAISSDVSIRNSIEHVKGYCLPGFQNAHSHAFQYAMAGLAEVHPDRSKSDDFWSWRETMYSIALSINPDQLEAIATMLYAEMLRHGYTSVAEFHYLHHNKSGNHFENKSEMGERLLAAAQTAGIKITLIPVFYQRGGFGKNIQTEQRRFVSNDLDEYLTLLEAYEYSVARYHSAKLAHGFHSLRAIDKVSIPAFFEQNKRNLPFHLHISEQLKEVEECQAYLGKRPVEWLLQNAPLDERFHLVHATHLTKEETNGIAKSGAHVVLCPSTEGNLGDGIFPLKPYQEAGGKWSIGTDSHIGLSPLEELRILDYSQRLTTHRRDQFVSDTNGDSGHFGYDMALVSGRAAVGTPSSNYFEVGKSLDAVVIDANNPLMITSQKANVLSTLVYSGDSSFLLGTIVNGGWKVKNQRHFTNESNVSRFRKAICELRIR